MKTVVLGGNSDIAKLLLAEDPDFFGEVRSYHKSIGGCPIPWDLMLVCCGAMYESAFIDADPDEWDACVDANVLYPLRRIREFLPLRRPQATIVLFAGSDPNKPYVGQSAYFLSKIMLTAAAEQLDAELADTKVFILGPGYMATKIHGKKLDKQCTDPKELMEMLKTCIAYPKSVIGGRNIHVRDDWRDLTKVKELDGYKLRRAVPGSSSAV